MGQMTWMGEGNAVKSLYIREDMSKPWKPYTSSPLHQPDKAGTVKGWSTMQVLKSAGYTMVNSEAARSTGLTQ